VSFYRVSVLDRNGVVAASRTAGTLPETAGLLVALGGCVEEEWAKPLLDAQGEFTVEVTRSGGRTLNDSDKAYLEECVQALGALIPEDDDELNRLRWHNPERQA
jgi:hypothetical protein